MVETMNFCSHCGAKVSLKIPDGDNLPRHVCDACGAIHYLNPRIIVGCVPEHEDGRILMCLRAIEPRQGFWTVPAGFMENGETLEQGAARETQEEALANVEVGSLLAVVNIVRVNQVHIFFRAHLIGDTYGAGEESLKSMLYEENDIPWDQIAFPSTEFALRRFFGDRANGFTNVHVSRYPRDD